MERESKKIYKVVSKKIETSSVTTLELSIPKGGKPDFLPGQYINVYFDEPDTPEGKAYSISSSPKEKNIAITVRNIGKFSNKLSCLSIGDEVKASLPYGFFSPDLPNSSLVLIAGGIGITPFRSILKNVLERDKTRSIHILHSIRTKEDAVFADDISDMKKLAKNLKTKYFITRENGKDDEDTKYRRIEKSDIPPQDKEEQVEYMVCGSISFTRDMWHALRELGIDQDYIYTEAFFSH